MIFSLPPRRAVLFALAGLAPIVAAAQARPRCDPDNGGLELPKGFCATVFADSVWGARHLTVAPNGDLIVSTYGRQTGGEGGSGGRGGGIVILRDRNGDGHADERGHFGNYRSSEVALHDGYLYTENSTDILRYPYKTGELRITVAPDTIVKGLPPGGHAAKTFAFGPDGALYVNIGSGDGASNACQVKDREPGSRGVDPCPQLRHRAGIWRFDAGKLDQRESAGERFATGIRNAVAIAFEPGDGLWVMQHGRDQLGGSMRGNWPQLFGDTANAELPAEELFHVERGDDFGWPYCYFDPFQKKKVLAPEYGGNGKEIGRCAAKKGNVAYFPAHWAPDGLLFYTGSEFPAKYRSGAFIAFHGSWNRAPLPQAGYNVVFQPLKNGRAGGPYEMFVGTFARPGGSVTHRPVGLAQAPDGAVYLSDDMGGRIWKIMYVGEK